MRGFCRHCHCPEIDLTTEFAQWVVDMIYLLLAERGGSVETQKELLGPLFEMFGISHGTGQHYIDALAARGCLRVERHGRRTKRKRVTALAPPDLPPTGPNATYDPGWPTKRSPLAGRDYPTVHGM